jgi:putative SOS response-associated peptidase YedK
MTLTTDDLDEVAAALDASLPPEAHALYRPHWNVAPSQVHWIARREGEARVLTPASFGLVKKSLVVNVRGETVATRLGQPGGLAGHRCVVPCDGFYEWTGEKRHKRPFWFHAPGGGVFALGAVFEESETRGEIHFAVITVPANREVGRIHDRMPLVIPRAQIGEWLDSPSRGLLVPAPPGALVGQAVSSRANSAEHDDPTCLAPPEQGELL